MQSFLVISKDQEKARSYVSDFANEHNISIFDIYTLETEKSLGISEVKKLANQIFLRPIKGDKKIIIVEAFYGATLEAQNSFLKTLEEPPLSTYIFILAHENYFLPTIISRSNVVILNKGIDLEKKEQIYFTEILENLEQNGTSYKLKLAQDLSKDKNEALSFLEKFIVFIRGKMISGAKVDSATHVSQYKEMLKKIQIYYKQLKESNVNLRLGLENLFLEL